MQTTQSRLPSQNLPWGGTGGTVVALVFGPTHDVTSVFTLTSINKSTTIEGLQSLILEETGIEPKAQYLRVVGGKFIDTSALTNRKLCWQQGIKSGSFLAVEKFWPGQIQIFCKTLSGATRTLRCYDNILVEDLKKQVEELEPVPAKAQRLIYAGQDLLDGRTLRDSKIQTEATVQLVLRLLGGVYYTSSKSSCQIGGVL